MTSSSCIQFGRSPSPSRNPHRSLSVLAEQFGGALDTVGSATAVRLGDDSFVVQLADNLLGAMKPGNRQQVSRWLSRENRSLSPYLQEGLGYANSEVLMILDVTDAITIDDVQKRMEEFEIGQAS